ncbi:MULTISPECIES: hypothetical protein [unclassified Rhizobium]|uniref:hypothetical protein n=1 Tax=unclassified Rhizobium TaxID=2613769 RepID=UPI00138EE4CA|nr:MULTISPECIES: hypothetical protein [unclassified Rhizobium]
MKLLLQDAKRLINIVVANRYLHLKPFEACSSARGRGNLSFSPDFASGGTTIFRDQKRKDMSLFAPPGLHCADHLDDKIFPIAGELEVNRELFSFFVDIFVGACHTIAKLRRGIVFANFKRRTMRTVYHCGGIPAAGIEQNEGARPASGAGPNKIWL